MNTEMKGMAAVTFLILGLLYGMNIAVSEEISMGAIVRTLLLLGAAAVFYLWMMRDQQTSEDAAEESMDEIEKQLEVIKEAVKEAKESATEVVKKAESEPAPPAKPEPVAAVEPPAKEPEPEPVAKATPAASPKAVSIDVAEDEEEPAPATPEPVTAASVEPDDLTRVEGIGPKYRDILVGAGIDTFAKLAALSEAEIEQVVKDNGGRKSASMATWAEQAKLAAAGDWDGLAKLQDELTGGRK